MSRVICNREREKKWAKWALRRFLKVFRLGEQRMSTGSEFHACGPANENARSPRTRPRNVQRQAVGRTEAWPARRGWSWCFEVTNVVRCTPTGSKVHQSTQKRSRKSHSHTRHNVLGKPIEISARSLMPEKLESTMQRLLFDEGFSRLDSYHNTTLWWTHTYTDRLLSQRCVCVAR